MKSYFGAIWAIVRKDVMLELRTKDFVVSVVVFSLLVIVIFSFAIEPTPQVVARVAPGVLWTAFVFGGVLGLTRSFALERDGGNLRGLLLAPAPRDAVYVGKMLASFLFMMLVELLVFPAFVVIFDLTLLHPALILVAVLATLGIAAVGTLFSAMAVNTRAREVMLPLLFLPAVIPVVIAAVEASAAALVGADPGEVLRWIPLLAAYDAVFLVACAFAFHFVVEE